MVTSKLLCSVLLAFLGFTGYANAVINIDALRNVNANEVGKEIEAYQRKFDDQEPDEEVAVALDNEMSVFATGVVNEPAVLEKLVNDVCATTQVEGVDCGNAATKFFINCSTVPYKCTSIGHVPIVTVGNGMVINTFDPIELTAALLLYKEVVRVHGNVLQRTYKRVYAKVVGGLNKLFRRGGVDYVNVEEKVFVDLLMDKLPSGVTARGLGNVVGEGAEAVSNEYILGVGLESIISSYVLFYRMLTINVTNNFHTTKLLQNKLAYRIYVMYFKNMKKVGRAITAAARAIFNGMDFMAITRLVKEIYNKLPDYLAGYSPEMAEHQVMMMAKLFVNTVHSAAIRVADIDAAAVKLTVDVAEVVNNICVDRKGETLTIPKCMAKRGKRGELKHNLNEFDYVLLKAIAAAHRRARLQGKGNIFKRGWHKMRKVGGKVGKVAGGFANKVTGFFRGLRGNNGGEAGVEENE